MLNRITNKKQKILLLLLTAILVVGVGTTTAFLVAKSLKADNKFSPSQVYCSVNETFIDNVKTDVRLVNGEPENNLTSDTSAYIRAQIIVTWQDDDGHIYGKEPVKGVDYDITYGGEEGTLDGSGWVQYSDGFYYFTEPVAKDSVTSVLIKKCEQLDTTVPDGYCLNVEILGSAIQADGVNEAGTKAVVDAWGIDPEELQ